MKILFALLLLIFVSCGRDDSESKRKLQEYQQKAEQSKKDIEAMQKQLDFENELARINAHADSLHKHRRRR